MNRIKVESSTIEEIGYDLSIQVLEVKFKKGTIYQYDGVDAMSVCNLLFAKSIGSHFMKQVAKVYNYQKLENNEISCSRIKRSKRYNF